ncbi:unnamed protein product [Caenorhabditis angaria]|uniref:Tyrosine-protein phosphatase domain-containing protein n=1 Tax=Caenorhabditis angaria TaxID=860376 RepID=A0A9P1IDK3_9PELO|nr:unnamed protein product [Caenorhabditis angaria]
MSRMLKKNKRTTRARSKTSKNENSMDEDDAPAAPGKDPMMAYGEKAIRLTANWIIKTNAAPGGLADWYAKQILDSKESSKSESISANFAAKNRMADLPCIETTRIKLKHLADGQKDYIHANLVKTIYAERTYIATQHPLESTFEDFWRMVFYENVDTIIAVFAQEDDLPLYFPNEAGKFGNYGKFFVNNRKVTQPTVKYTPVIHQIEILPEGCSNSRIITLLHYAYWPKNQFPVSPRIVMKTLRCVKSDKTTNGPLLIHCSNGLNRVGCFILSDLMFDLAFRNIDTDIPKMVKSLRAQRFNLLSNKLHFVYSCFVFLDYVRIRCKKYNVFPDLLKEINEFEVTINKEIGLLCVKEPPPQKNNTKKDCTIDE